MIRHPLRRILAGTALAALAATPSLAANVLRIDISGTGTVRTLTITQDATHASNVLTANGQAGGGHPQRPVR